MNKKIRSISLERFMDEKLYQDSRARGMSVSANITRILYDYFNQQGLLTVNKPMNVLKTTNK
jgi:hypothetical protein